jgi:hypothetical protein
MGGKSQSSTAQTTSQQTTNTQTVNTSTVGLDNVETGVVGSNNTITQISTDQGAVEAGRAIGERALDVVGETAEGAFGVATDALGTVERGLDASLDFGTGVVGDAFSFGEKAIAAQAATSQQTATVLSGAIERAAQATRTDSADTLQKIGKYGTVAVVVIVIGGIALYALTRRKGGG